MSSSHASGIHRHLHSVYVQHYRSTERLLNRNMDKCSSCLRRLHLLQQAYSNSGPITREQRAAILQVSNQYRFAQNQCDILMNQMDSIEMYMMQCNMWQQQAALPEEQDQEQTQRQGQGVVQIVNMNDDRVLAQIMQYLVPVPVVPTADELSHATRMTTYSAIDTPYNTQCPITMEVFQPNDRVLQLVHCGHVFSESAQEWFTQHVSCPVCRHDIRNGSL